MIVVTVRIPAPKNSRFTERVAQQFIGEDVQLGRAVVGQVVRAALGREGAYILLDAEINEGVTVLTDASLVGLSVTKPA